MTHRRDITLARTGRIRRIEDRVVLLLQVGCTLDLTVDDHTVLVLLTHVVDDRLDLFPAVTQILQRQRNQRIGEYHVPTANKLLIGDMREEGLDGGRVTIHSKGYRTRRRHHRNLCISVPVVLAEFHRTMPCADHRLTQIGSIQIGQSLRIQTIRLIAQVLISVRSCTRRSRMITDDPLHVVLVQLVSGEGTDLFSHQGGDLVTSAGQERDQCSRVLPRLIGVVGHALDHQERSEVSNTESRCAEYLGTASDICGRELPPIDRRLEHKLHQVDIVCVTVKVEDILVRIVEGVEIQGSKVTARIVQEGIFATRIRRVQPVMRRPELTVFACGAGVPLIKCICELGRGIRTAPSRLIELLPEITDLDLAIDRIVYTTDKLDNRIRFHLEQIDLLHKLVVDP